MANNQGINYGKLYFAAFFNLKDQKDIDKRWKEESSEQRARFEEAAQVILQTYHRNAAPFTVESRIVFIEQKAEDLAFESMEAERADERELAQQLRANLTHLRHRMSGAAENICQLSDSARKFERNLRHEELGF